MAGLPKNENSQKRRNKKHLRLLIIAILTTLIIVMGFYSAIIFATAKPLKMEIEEGKYYHQPYLAQKCDSCHVAGTEGEGLQLKAPVEELCYTCHRETGQQLTKHSLHKPFLEGKCLDCHEPHKSENSHLLRQPLKELCYQCHGDLKTRLESDAHQSLDGVADRGVCSNCHTSHASDFPPLLTDESVSLCQSCHNQGPRERNHPVGKPFIDERTGGELTCFSTCHDPHGSEYPPMLRQPNLDGLCLTCHQGAGDLW